MMILDRKMTMFIAIVTLVAAVLLASGHVVNDDPIEDWVLTAILAVISLSAWVWIWQSDLVQPSELMVIGSADESPQPQEWLISKEPIEEKPAAHLAGKVEVPQAMPKAAGVSASEVEPDDLTRVEGIGPKYRDALIEAGVRTFDELAALTLEQIEQIASDAGMRRAASMETWVEQAKLAARGDWEGLDKLQEQLSGGRRDG